MTRFVRIIPDPDPRADAGSRIRVDYDPDDTGAFGISDENVLPERLHDPNCNRVQVVANIEIDRPKARAIRDAMVELCAHLDDEERAAKELEARAIVAAAHGVPLSAVQVVRSEPEISSAALDRHLKNMAPVIDAINAGIARSPSPAEISAPIVDSALQRIGESVGLDLAGEVERRMRRPK